MLATRLDTNSRETRYRATLDRAFVPAADRGFFSLVSVPGVQPDDWSLERQVPCSCRADSFLAVTARSIAGIWRIYPVPNSIL